MRALPLIFYQKNTFTGKSMKVHANLIRIVSCQILLGRRLFNVDFLNIRINSFYQSFKFLGVIARIVIICFIKHNL